ncbi:uncharacterized protein LOC129588084 [Paramacrobiotus metropolitanus]|uniref:uncharacterized protein LOC129588084 n=1 Tax=Paramacrobiotus metropolitanus TaxID=2943436 RepID=UPI002445B91F|nr:uncharacterized protein LOC129588084 [Paramacrobiotus metropolitanus]
MLHAFLQPQRTMSSSCVADPLFLVFDTSALIAPRNSNHPKSTYNQLQKTGLELLRSFASGTYGSLPSSLKVRIPWVVKLELMGLSNPAPGVWFHPDSRSSQAENAVDFLDEVTYNNPNGVVTYQSYLESQEAKQLQKRPKDNDELVLLCCLQTRETYSRNVWLVTNDVRLSARAMRSGIGSLSLAALRHAMTLRNGDGAQDGDTFVDEVPESWAKMNEELCGLRNGTVLVHPVVSPTPVSADRPNRQLPGGVAPFTFLCAQMRRAPSMMEWILRKCLEIILKM